jgi:hypothetical protein
VGNESRDGGARVAPRVISQESGNDWMLYNGDSTEVLAGIPESSIDLSVFSPPFATLYTYSASARDVGNARDEDEFWTHLRFIGSELLRVTKPGRLICVHVAQIPTQKAKDGVIGLSDFRGETIRRFTGDGWIYHGEVCIDKDPQAQAIRTKSKSLLFVQLRKDASWLRQALADYILVFRKPGENTVPIHPDLSNDDWILWARPIWYGIRESDTLNVAEARGETMMTATSARCSSEQLSAAFDSGATPVRRCLIRSLGLAARAMRPFAWGAALWALSSSPSTREWLSRTCVRLNRRSTPQRSLMRWPRLQHDAVQRAAARVGATADLAGGAPSLSPRHRAQRAHHGVRDLAVQCGHHRRAAVSTVPAVRAIHPGSKGGFIDE